MGSKSIPSYEDYPSMDSSRPPPSPLSGGYLLMVMSEPQIEPHKAAILQKITKAFLSWDVTESGIDIERELAILTALSPEGDLSKSGERLIQNASEQLVTEILIQPQINTLRQCIRNLLSSFTKYRFIIHAGYAFSGNGSWILQDGTFSMADFVDAFQEIAVQRVIKAYEKTVKIDICCIAEGAWSQLRINQQPFSKLCRIEMNPSDKIPAGTAAVKEFAEYLDQFIVAQDICDVLEPSEVVGNIRFSRPTLYVFPGGDGDAALFGINGFNMLVDGGFNRRACFWNFVRHLDRLDAVLLTRVNNANMAGIAGIVQRKVLSPVYPQIGHFFTNLQGKKTLPSTDGDKDKDMLLVNLIEEGNRMVMDLKQLQLKPHPCYRDPNNEPINLYHKVGHGKLDMYVISPAKDSREVKEFLSNWHNHDVKLFSACEAKGGDRDLRIPVQNLASICALLVWQPANPDDHVTRILFPGSAPQYKIFEGFDRMKEVNFLKSPKCQMKSILPAVQATATTKKKMKFSDEKISDKIITSQDLSNLQTGINTKMIKTTSDEVKKTKITHKQVEKSKVITDRAKTTELKSGGTTEYMTVNSTENKVTEKKTNQIAKNKNIEKQIKAVEKKVKAGTGDEKATEYDKSSPTTPKKSLTITKDFVTTGLNNSISKTVTSLISAKTPPKVLSAKRLKEENNRKMAKAKQENKITSLKAPTPITTTGSISTIAVNNSTTSTTAVSKVFKKEPVKAIGITSSKAIIQSTPQTTIATKPIQRPLTTNVTKNTEDQKKIPQVQEEVTLSSIPNIIDTKKNTTNDELKTKVIRKSSLDNTNIKNVGLKDEIEPSIYISNIMRKETNDGDDEILIIETTEINSIDKDKINKEESKYLQGKTESENEVMKASIDKNVNNHEQELAQKRISFDDKEDISNEPNNISTNTTEKILNKEYTSNDNNNINDKVLQQRDDLKEIEIPKYINAESSSKMEHEKQEIEEKYDTEDTKEKTPEQTSLANNFNQQQNKLPSVPMKVMKRDLVKTPDEVADLPVYEEASIHEISNISQKPLIIPIINQSLISETVKPQLPEFVNITPSSSPDEKINIIHSAQESTQQKETYKQSNFVERTTSMPLDKIDLQKEAKSQTSTTIESEDNSSTQMSKPTSIINNEGTNTASKLEHKNSYDTKKDQDNGKKSSKITDMQNYDTSTSLDIPINFDKKLGIPEKQLQLRNETLDSVKFETESSNIVKADYQKIKQESSTNLYQNTSQVHKKLDSITNSNRQQSQEKCNKISKEGIEIEIQTNSRKNSLYDKEDALVTDFNADYIRKELLDLNISMKDKNVKSNTSNIDSMNLSTLKTYPQDSILETSVNKDNTDSQEKIGQLQDSTMSEIIKDNNNKKEDALILNVIKKDSYSLLEGTTSFEKDSPIQSKYPSDCILETHSLESKSADEKNVDRKNLSSILNRNLNEQNTFSEEVDIERKRISSIQSNNKTIQKEKKEISFISDHENIDLNIKKERDDFSQMTSLINSASSIPLMLSNKKEVGLGDSETVTADESSVLKIGVDEKENTESSIIPECKEGDMHVKQEKLLNPSSNETGKIINDVPIQDSSKLQGQLLLENIEKFKKADANIECITARKDQLDIQDHKIIENNDTIIKKTLGEGENEKRNLVQSIANPIIEEEIQSTIHSEPSGREAIHTRKENLIIASDTEKFNNSNKNENIVAERKDTIQYFKEDPLKINYKKDNMQSEQKSNVNKTSIEELELSTKPENIKVSLVEHASSSSFQCEQNIKPIYIHETNSNEKENVYKMFISDSSLNRKVENITSEKLKSDIELEITDSSYEIPLSEPNLPTLSNIDYKDMIPIPEQHTEEQTEQRCCMVQNIEGNNIETTVGSLYKAKSSNPTLICNEFTDNNSEYIIKSEDISIAKDSKTHNKLSQEDSSTEKLLKELDIYNKDIQKYNSSKNVEILITSTDKCESEYIPSYQEDIKIAHNGKAQTPTKTAEPVLSQDSRAQISLTERPIETSTTKQESLLKTDILEGEITKEISNIVHTPLLEKSEAIENICSGKLNKENELVITKHSTKDINEISPTKSLKMNLKNINELNSKIIESQVFTTSSELPAENNSEKVKSALKELDNGNTKKFKEDSPDNMKEVLGDLHNDKIADNKDQYDDKVDTLHNIKDTDVDIRTKIKLGNESALKDQNSCFILKEQSIIDPYSLPENTLKNGENEIRSKSKPTPDLNRGTNESPLSRSDERAQYISKEFSADHNDMILSDVEASNTTPVAGVLRESRDSTMNSETGSIRFHITDEVEGVPVNEGDHIQELESIKGMVPYSIEKLPFLESKTSVQSTVVSIKDTGSHDYSIHQDKQYSNLNDKLPIMLTNMEEVTTESSSSEHKPKIQSGSYSTFEDMSKEIPRCMVQSIHTGTSPTIETSDYVESKSSGEIKEMEVSSLGSLIAQDIQASTLTAQIDIKSTSNENNLISDEKVSNTAAFSTTGLVPNILKSDSILQNSHMSDSSSPLLKLSLKEELSKQHSTVSSHSEEYHQVVQETTSEKTNEEIYEKALHKESQDSISSEEDIGINSSVKTTSSIKSNDSDTSEINNFYINPAVTIATDENLSKELGIESSGESEHNRFVTSNTFSTTSYMKPAETIEDLYKNEEKNESDIDTRSEYVIQSREISPALTSNLTVCDAQKGQIQERQDENDTQQSYEDNNVDDSMGLKKDINTEIRKCSTSPNLFERKLDKSNSEDASTSITHSQLIKNEQKDKIEKTTSWPLTTHNSAIANKGEKHPQINISIEGMQVEQDFSKTSPYIEKIIENSGSVFNLSNSSLQSQSPRKELKLKSVSLPAIKKADDSEEIMKLPHLYKTLNLEDLTTVTTSGNSGWNPTELLTAHEQVCDKQTESSIESSSTSCIISPIKETDEPLLLDEHISHKMYESFYSKRSFNDDDDDDDNDDVDNNYNSCQVKSLKTGDPEVIKIQDSETTMENAHKSEIEKVVTNVTTTTSKSKNQTLENISQHSTVISQQGGKVSDIPETITKSVYESMLSDNDDNDDLYEETCTAVTEITSIPCITTSTNVTTIETSTLMHTSHQESERATTSSDKDPISGWGKPLGLPFSKKALLVWNPLENWGKPLGLPSPSPPSTLAISPHRNGNNNIELNLTPVNTKLTPKKSVSKKAVNEKINQGREASRTRDTSTRRNIKSCKQTPVYIDLTYVPHHGNPYYTNVEFFKRIRARYYVFSGTDASKEVFDALLEGKRSWENSELEVTIIPTYDTDILGYWITENEETLSNLKIDLAPSASRCTINLQDHETSCSAYRLEF